MVKPILIVHVPPTYGATEAEKVLKGLQASGITDDYYTLAIPHNTEFMDFKLLSVNDMDEVKYKDLKSSIENAFKEIENGTNIS